MMTLLLMIAVQLHSRSLALIPSLIRMRHNPPYRGVGCRARVYSRTSPSSDDVAQLQAITCESSEDIESVGSYLSEIVDDIDVLLLRGDLGAGKTTLTRGLIRSKFNDPEMMVTSPSYLLDNCYQYGEHLFIHHMDLYRLPAGCDMGILNIPNVFSTSLSIIEWPDRLSPELIPESYLGLTISIDSSSQQRSIQLEPRGKKWEERAPQLNQLIESIISRNNTA